MSSSDSWEEVTDVREAKKYQKMGKDRRLIAIHQIMWILKRVREESLGQQVPNIEIQENNFNRYKMIESFVSKLDKNELEKKISIFKLCIKHKIPIRIGFILADTARAFLETCLVKKADLNPIKYDFEVIGIDYMLNLVDMTFLYSKRSKKLSLSSVLVRFVKQSLFGIHVSGDSESIFVKEDRDRMMKIPTSLAKIKKHPIYITEQQVGKRQAIFPKRPVYGYFRGQAVYSKKNVHKLYTERQLYHRGKRINSKKPYRVVSEKKLYAPWQVEDITVPCLYGSKYMDYFHPNFLPIDCFYSSSNSSEDVAQLLGIRYANCVTRFSNGMPVSEGVFVEKKNAYAYLNFLKEYNFYKNLLSINTKGLKSIYLYERLIKRAKRYLEIRKRLG